MKKKLFCAVYVFLVITPLLVSSAEIKATQIELHDFLPVRPMSRAQQAVLLSSIVLNTGDEPAEVAAKLTLPDGVRVLRTNADQPIKLARGDSEALLTWEVESATAQAGVLRLELLAGSKVVAQQSLRMQFLPAVVPRKLPYIPDPEPVPTSLLVGAHNCPLWETDKPNMWLQLLKHPERTPALGFYAQENPEVADWETKWAVEHGVSFFIYCWYRANQGGPVQLHYGSGIHKALFKSRFAGKMKYTIMWENQSRGQAGVSNEQDLMQNLLPFWLENYFMQPGYLKVDGKPVLFIYRPEFLIQDLGGETNVVKALDKMRQACRDAGFAGLYILGEYRGLDPKHLKLMKRLGLDYTFAYCWGIANNPTPEEAIQKQMEYIRKTQELRILPQVVTVSQAWSGWRDEGSIWKIPPADFERLLRQAKDFTATLPKAELGSRMLLLDNWNEWGEGHYIAPYREYGFGYLDAVRNVFASAPPQHEDLLPEDVGLGPYDTAMRQHYADRARFNKILAQKVVTSGVPAGLVGWWTFDEAASDAVALDYSGHRHGGALQVQTTRAPGRSGSALVCDGGSVVVPEHPELSPTNGLTIECWVKTDVAGQNNWWMINRVFGGCANTGYRLGLVGGRPCLEIPQTNWSHSLAASAPLPLGRWVHLAGTFDKHTMRLYVDGVEQGSLDRSGPIKPNHMHLILGNYDVGCASHFVGLLDDVRLYDRALSPGEIRAHAAAPP
ncbi:MAG: hypothetical protein EPN23_00595 [Verrucomicrobia bacterium]|nr:MAG: hypothetical protein EPN23_00595 [Verrucomicrobiota bacterium]